jgi:hypothetical protein
MTTARLAAGTICAALALALAACGESPQVVNYKQGTYQGKRDTPPYDSPEFKGNKQAWENAIKTRQQNQNEYKREG